jgi:hypothetical protein
VGYANRWWSGLTAQISDQGGNCVFIASVIAKINVTVIPQIVWRAIARAVHSDDPNSFSHSASVHHLYFKLQGAACARRRSAAATESGVITKRMTSAALMCVCMYSVKDSPSLTSH